MAAVTEEELQKKREDNAKLREQIAAADADATVRAAEQSREVEAKKLDAENARLQNQLARAKAAAKVSSAKEGASTPLAAAKQQLTAAQAASTQVGPVDTNAGNGTNNKE